MATDGNPVIPIVQYPEEGNVTIDNPIVRDFCDYCLKVKPRSDFADQIHFDPFKLRPWLGFIVILEHLPVENDFRYRIYGTHLADQTGLDMTGRLVSDYDVELSQINMQLYRESVEKRQLMYSAHTRIYARYDCDWRRIICSVEAGEKFQVVAFSYPVERPKRRQFEE